MEAQRPTTTTSGGDPPPPSSSSSSSSSATSRSSPPLPQTPSSGSSSSSSSVHQQSPLTVGREFVRQYYTLMTHAPWHMFRFYSLKSSFSHGGGENEAEPVKGQDEIHKKLMQLDFHNCQAKILQVDAHSTLGDGIVVQVSGELSNKGQAMRRFMQTVVLVMQSPKQYYVHNDIFRYQDEVFGTVQLQSQTFTSAVAGDVNNPAAAAPGAITSQNHKIISADNHNDPVFDLEGMPNNFPSVCLEQEHRIVNGETSGPRAAVASNDGRNGFDHIAESSTNSVDNIDAAKEQEEPAPLSGISLMSPQPTPEMTAEEEAAEDYIEDYSKDYTEDVQQPMLQQATVAENGKTVPEEILTYASLVKSSPRSNLQVGGASSLVGVKSPDLGKDDRGLIGNNNAKQSLSERVSGSQNGSSMPGWVTALPASGPAAAAKREYYGSPMCSGATMQEGDYGPERRRPRSSNSNSSFSGTSSGFSGRSSRQQHPGGQQLFIGNIPHDCEVADLEQLFSKFGRVAELRIDKKVSLVRVTPAGKRVPNYGFVTFEEESSAVECLKSGPILLPMSDHKLNVEERKSQGWPENGVGTGNLGYHRGGYERGNQEYLPAGHGTGGEGRRGMDRGRGSPNKRRGGGEGPRGGSTRGGGWWQGGPKDVGGGGGGGSGPPYNDHSVRRRAPYT